MKRSVKILIIVLAIALVLGVGAISFAKWSGGGSSTATADGKAGTINTVGDITVKATYGGEYDEKDGNTMEKLLPIDNGNVDGTKYWGFEVALDGSIGDVTVKLTGEITSEAGDVDAELYYSLTVPSAAAPGDLLTADGTTITLDEDSKTATVYVCMIAYSANAMNATITLTFEATV